jgi:3-deoxy-D-manno-octulosonate 8-phosphate phosphatase (KDO 8-P phosphatase)
MSATHSSDRTTEARARAARVRFMLFDIDGVFTDGQLLFGADGEQLKVFHVHDGHGLKLLRESGIAVGVLSGRSSEAARTRMRELGVAHAVYGAHDKLAALDALIAAAGASRETTGFMGDDWVDLAVMHAVGFAVSVPNAASRMLEHAHWVSRRSGGRGAVRDAAEFILDAQGRLDMLFEQHCKSGCAQG